MLKNTKAFNDQQKFCEKIIKKKTLETLIPVSLEFSSPTKLGKSQQ